MQVKAWKDRGRSEEDTDCTFGLIMKRTDRDQYFDGLAKAEVLIEGKKYTFELDRESF